MSGVYRTNDYESSESQNKTALNTSLILLVLNAVVVGTASAQQFDVLGLSDRYVFHEFVTIMAASVFAATIVYMWLACVSLSSESTCCAGLTATIAGCIVIACVAWFIGMYVYAGRLWHDDPRHNILFYGPFWNEGVTQPRIDQYTADIARASNSTSAVPRADAQLASMWVYVMSDVVIRLHEFSLMLLPVLAGVFVCMGGTAFLASGSKRN